MADIAATDLTYSLQQGSQFASPSDPHYSAVFSVGFGDGALTYPTGGIPLTKGKLGCPTAILDLMLVEPDADDGILYKYDQSANTIRMYQIPATVDAAPAAPLAEYSGAPAATVLVIKVRGY